MKVCTSELLNLLVETMKSIVEDIIDLLRDKSLLLFLIYINDLPNTLNSNVKFFADDTSLFSVHNTTDSANLLISHLFKISEWALQWKMSFNPDLIKQPQEIIFSCKRLKENHPGLMFNDNIVNITTIHEHLGMILDSKLSFDEPLKVQSCKFKKH